MDTHQRSEGISTQPGMRLQKSFVSTTPYSPGRRPFFKYRDLGLEGATGVRHNEIYASEDKEALEVSVPGSIETVTVERPAGLPEKLKEVSNERP